MLPALSWIRPSARQAAAQGRRQLKWRRWWNKTPSEARDLEGLWTGNPGSMDDGSREERVIKVDASGDKEDTRDGADPGHLIVEDGGDAETRAEEFAAADAVHNAVDAEAVRRRKEASEEADGWNWWERGKVTGRKSGCDQVCRDHGSRWQSNCKRRSMK
jgi:hypothetical protein